MERFEVWYSMSKKVKSPIGKDMKYINREPIFLGYYGSLEEIVNAFNEKETVFDNGVIKNIYLVSDSIMNAITRLARKNAIGFARGEMLVEDLNAIKIIDIPNKDKVNSAKEIAILNSSSEFMKLCNDEDGYAFKWCLTEEGNNRLLVWTPVKEKELATGAILTLDIIHNIDCLCQPLVYTREIGRCTKAVFSGDDMKKIIFGNSDIFNPFITITNKVLLNKKLIYRLFLNGRFEIDEMFCSDNPRLKIKVSFGKETLAEILVMENTKEVNEKFHAQIDNGQIKKLILSAGGYPVFVDLTEEDKKDIHTMYKCSEEKKML